MNGYGRGEDKQNENGGSVVTRETFGMTLLFLSVILLVFSMVGPYIMGDIGRAITSFLYGSFGFFLYPFFALLIYGSLSLIAGRKFVSKKTVLRAALLSVCVFLIAHLATSVRFSGNGFGAYMNGCWTAAGTSSLQSTAGGAMFGLIVYPALSALTLPGAYVVFSILTVAAFVFFLFATPARALFVRKAPRERTPKAEKSEPLPSPKRFEEASENNYPNYNRGERRNLKPPLFDRPVYDRNFEPYDEGEDARPDTAFGQGAQGEYNNAPRSNPPFSQNGARSGYEQRGSVQNGNGYFGTYENLQSQGGFEGKGRLPMRPIRNVDQFQESESALRSYPRSTPSPYERERMERPQEEPKRQPTAKELLYSKDPVRDYWSNLAYNGDGYYTNRIRKSSVQPVSNDYQKPYERPTYGEEYSAQAEQPQRHVTRQVIENRPAERESDGGYSLRTLNYAHIPHFPAVQGEPPEKEEEKPAAREELFSADRLEEKKEDFSRDRDRDELFSSRDDVKDARGRDELFSSRDDVKDARGRDELFEDEPKEDFSRDRGRDELFSSRDEEKDARGRDELFSSRDEVKEDFSRDRDRDELFSDDNQEDFSRDRDRGRDELFSDDNQEDFSRDRDRGRDELFSDRDEVKDARDSVRDDALLRPDERQEERTFERRREDMESFPRDDLFEESESEEDYRFGEEKMPNLFPGRDEDEQDFDRDTSRDFAENEFRDDRYAGDGFSQGDRLPQAEFSREEQYAAEPSRAEKVITQSRADLFEDDDIGPLDEVGDAEPLPPPKKKHVYRPYQRPSLSHLKKYDDKITVSQDEIDRNSAIIIDTLAGFRVDAEVTRVTPGPSVTRYDIDIPRNIALNSVTKRSGEIAMRLHARDGVNMYANNEAGTISIEVPNAVRATVGLSSVMESEEYKADKPGSLLFAIGKDIEGRNVCGDIPKMTHILVAGTTNAGKSVALNAMLVSLVCKYSPEELRLILVDPKRTEFIVYDGLPHLMINEIIGDAQKAIMALNWSIKEMERRYALFEQKTRSGVAVRNVDEYNMNLTEDEEKLPKIVFVVDELADLMSVAKKDIEERIQRLTQKARAAGIHLVLATQRPSVDVITGVIKGNLPTRMAVRVIQEVDSRTILDEGGAEKLLGMGDMLYKAGGMFNCKRVQGAFISTGELQAIMEDIKEHNESYFDPEVSDYINRAEDEEEDDEDADHYAGGGRQKSGDAEPLYIKALSMVVKLGSASISLIQRRCGVGYNHAGKIMEWMEEKGYVSPFDGKAKARTVLLTKEEFESMYGPIE